MAASNWKQSLEAVLKSEGGNDDDPLDHGGRTSRGITQREYDAWRREHNQPVMDVWKAPQADIEAIYHDEYWMPHCDLLPVGADFLLFNMNVNAGLNRGAKLLQKALRVNPDGRIGALTREAIRHIDSIQLIERYSAECRAFYLGLHQPRFTKGWLNRVEFVRKTALGMITQKGIHT
jgi:lysozyme family protein